MSILSAQDINQIKSDIRNIVHDTSINTTIRYRQYVGESYDPEDQSYTDPYTNWSGVSAVKGVVTRNEVERVGGVEVGDTKFVIMQSDVSGTLSVSDLVVESGSTFNIRRLTLDDLGIAYVIYGYKS